jgi:erythromycin esterase-like protein
MIDATTLLDLLGTKPRLLALGEPTHGEDDLLALRNDLLRQLVEQGDYRTIAVESDCLMGLVVDDYIAGGDGDLDDVMARGFSHEWGAFGGNRDLVRSLRAYNEGRPAAERVRFAGFDGPLEITHGQRPRQPLTALRDYLQERVDVPCTAEELDRLIGADDRWTNQAAMMDPAQSIGQTPDARALRLLADDLVALLDAQTPHLIATSTSDEWERAKLYGRTSTGLLRYHHWLADDSPNRLSWLCALRDSMMAANLLALADREPTFVFAHNSHLQRDPSSMRMGPHLVRWWSAGAIVNAKLGPDYAFVAMALGTIRHQGVDTPPPDTLEGLLYQRSPEQFLVDPRDIEAELNPRVSTWYGYAALDPAQLPTIDGLVYVKDSRG